MKKVNFENLTAFLEAEGIEGEEITIVKNGIPCTGFRIVNPMNPMVSPIVYYSQEETLETFVEKVKQALSLDPPKFDSKMVFSERYLRDHLIMGIQREYGGDENLVIRKILNIELYLRIIIDQTEGAMASIKITRDNLHLMEICENEAWDYARSNMILNFRVCSMAQMLGMPEAEAITPFQVLIADEKLDGATALAFPEFLEDYLTATGESWCYILPSSTQELLILPGSDAEDLDVSGEVLACMVDEVNTEVDPLIQLAPVCYRYERGNREVTIAATIGEEVR